MQTASQTASHRDIIQPTCRHICVYTYHTCAGIQTGCHIDGQAGIPTDRQTARHTDVQMDRHNRYVHTCSRLFQLLVIASAVVFLCAQVVIRNFVRQMNMHFKSLDDVLSKFKPDPHSGCTKAATKFACLLGRLTLLEKLSFKIHKLDCHLDSARYHGHTHWRIYVMIWLKPQESWLSKYVHPDEHHISVCRFNGSHDRLVSMMPLVKHLCEDVSWRLPDDTPSFPRFSVGRIGTVSMCQTPG